MAATKATLGVIADDAVGVSQLSATGTASSSTYLRGDNSWAAISASNDYEFVSSVNGSGASVLKFENMADGYDYIYVGDTMTVNSDGVWMKAEIGVAGPTYRTSGYYGTKWGVNNSGNSTSSERTTDFPLVAGDDEGMGTGTNEGVRAFECTLYNPANASTMTAFLGEAVNYGSTPALIGTKAAGFYATAEANTCVRFEVSGGTLTGTIKQFRRKRS